MLLSRWNEAVEAASSRHDAAFGRVTAEIREVEIQIPEVEGVRRPGLRIVGALEPCVGKLSVAARDARPALSAGMSCEMA